MSDDTDEVEWLRRIVYGPGATAEDRAAAVADLRVLADRESDGQVGVSAPLEAEEVEPAADFELYEEPERPRGIRPLWLVPIVAASIAVGAIGALAVSPQLEAPPPSALPSQSPDPVEPTPPSQLEGGPGDLEAAERWFDGGATEGDAFPDPTFLQGVGIEPDNVRFMGSEGDDWSVWVAKDHRGQFCLLVKEAIPGGAAANCATADEFSRNGITIGLNGRSSYWDGATVYTDRSPAG
jgi:hypothetical protein